MLGLKFPSAEAQPPRPEDEKLSPEVETTTATTEVIGNEPDDPDEIIHSSKKFRPKVSRRRRCRKKPSSKVAPISNVAAAPSMTPSAKCTTARDLYVSLRCEWKDPTTCKLLKRVVLVNWDGTVLHNLTVGRRHGSWKAARAKVQHALRGKVVIGHGLDLCLYSLQISHHSWSNMRDCAQYLPFLQETHDPLSVMLVPRTLHDLAKQFLAPRTCGLGGETDPTVEEARIAMQLYRYARVDWEAQVTTLLRQKEIQREMFLQNQRWQQEQELYEVYDAEHQIFENHDSDEVFAFTSDVHPMNPVETVPDMPSVDFQHFHDDELPERWKECLPDRVGDGSTQTLPDLTQDDGDSPFMPYDHRDEELIDQTVSESIWTAESNGTGTNRKVPLWGLWSHSPSPLRRSINTDVSCQIEGEEEGSATTATEEFPPLELLPNNLLEDSKDSTLEEAHEAMDIAYGWSKPVSNKAREGSSWFGRLRRKSPSRKQAVEMDNLYTSKAEAFLPSKLLCDDGDDSSHHATDYSSSRDKELTGQALVQSDGEFSEAAPSSPPLSPRGSSNKTWFLRLK